MRTLVAIVFLMLIASAYNQQPQPKDTPEQRLAALYAAEQDLVRQAEPYALAAISAVQKQVTQANVSTQAPVARPARSPRANDEVDAPDWAKNSSFKYCYQYGDPAWHNVVCYGRPRMNTEMPETLD